MRKERNTMLISPDEVKAVEIVNYNVNDDMIGYAIRTSQEMYLQEIIGTPLYHRLQELVYNAIINKQDNIDEDENIEYAMLLDEYIQPFLVAETTVELLMPLTFKVRNVGVSQNTDTNINSTSMNDVKYVITYNNTKVAQYKTRLSQYLCENRDLFPELEESCGCGGVAPQIGRKYANTGLHLNVRRGCCK